MKSLPAPLTPRILLLASLLAPCDASASSVSGETAPRHLFYLHGHIVQMEGPEAVSSRFGPYRFKAIIDALGGTGVTVHAPLRPRSQDNADAADQVAADVRALLASGVPASAITVVGASRGAIIAMLVSDRLSEPALRFVLLGACNDWVFDQLRPTLSGAFLSIYEAGDEFGGSCEPLMRTQPGVLAFEEIRLETGLGHGFLYAPLDAWVRPAMRWSQASMPHLDQ